MRLIRAGAHAVIDRYLGYYEPYATSHYALDADEALQREVVAAAQALEACVARMRDGWRPPEQDESQPRPK